MVRGARRSVLRPARVGFFLGLLPDWRQAVQPALHKARPNGANSRGEWSQPFCGVVAATSSSDNDGIALIAEV